MCGYLQLRMCEKTHLVENHAEEKQTDVEDFVDNHFPRETDYKKHGAAAENPVLHQKAFKKGCYFIHHAGGFSLISHAWTQIQTHICYRHITAAVRFQKYYNLCYIYTYSDFNSSGLQSLYFKVASRCFYHCLS